MLNLAGFRIRLQRQWFVVQKPICYTNDSFIGGKYRGAKSCKLPNESAHEQESIFIWLQSYSVFQVHGSSAGPRRLLKPRSTAKSSWGTNGLHGPIAYPLPLHQDIERYNEQLLRSNVRTFHSIISDNSFLYLDDALGLSVTGEKCFFCKTLLRNFWIDRVDNLVFTWILKKTLNSINFWRCFHVLDVMLYFSL